MRRLLSVALVRAASVFVPATSRDRFVREWRAELAHEPEEGRGLRRALGAFADAAALRRYASRPRRRDGRLFAAVAELTLAARSLARRPGWSAIVITTLAVGIGANTAIFGVLHAVLLAPLSYAEPSRLVKIVSLDVPTGAVRNLSPADFYDLREGTETVESMGAHGWVGFFPVSDDGEPVRVAGSNVTADFFETLGVRPARGRLFTEADDVPGAPDTAVLTDAFWRARYGADPDIVGRSIRVNAVAHEVIGVLPPGYRHPEPNPEREPALYAPYGFERGAFRSGRFIRAVGRLRPGVEVEEAEAELRRIAARLTEAYPESNTGVSVSLRPLKDAIVGSSRRSLYLLFGAVVALLLIACTNIANLTLARGQSRRQELAVKTALGAGRARIARELFWESLLLATSGGLLGLLVAHVAGGYLSLGSVPRAADAGLSAQVLLFTAAVSVGASLLAGVLPGLAVATPRLRNELVRARPRQLLVALEVALSVVLLVSAALLATSLFALRSTSPGFEPAQVLAMQVSLPTASYAEGEQIPFYVDVYDHLESLPGVTAVGAINILPLSQNHSSDGFQIDRRPVPEGQAPSAEARSVGRDYFEVMRIPLLRGRSFTRPETSSGDAGVVVISESMAERFWPGEDPLGERITYNRGIPGDAQQPVGGPGSREIVGIVGDVKHFGLDGEATPTFYTPQRDHPSFHTMTLVVESATPLATLARALREKLSAMDPDVPLYQVATLGDVVERSVRAPRDRARLLGLFAALAVALSLVGVYSVMSVSVAQRTREIGIRAALGARGAAVIGLLLRQQMAPVVYGLLAGVAGAVLVARSLESLLYGVAATDPRVYGVVALLVAASALAAALLPAARALDVDPATVLRADS